MINASKNNLMTPLKKENYSLNSFIHQNNIVHIHFLIFSLGLFKLSYLFLEMVYKFFDFNTAFILSGLSDFIVDFNTKKSIHIYAYIVFMLSIFLYYGIGIMIQRFVSHKNNIYSKSSFFIFSYLIFALVLNLSFLFSTHGLFFFATLWYIALCGIAMSFLNIFSQYTLPQWISGLIIFIISLQLIFIFIPLILSPIMISNDYNNIPEKTILKNKSIVDNINYINTHAIGGLLRYDPRKNYGESPLPRKNTFEVLDWNPLLEIFLNVPENKYRFYYDHQINALVSINQFTKKDWINLEKIYSNSSNKEKLTRLYYYALANNLFYKKRTYSMTEKDFIIRNRTELYQQAQAGWFFHHHGEMLTSINAVLNGEPFSKQTFLYGALCTITLAKLMQWLNHINYGSYFKLLFSAYLLYHIIFLAIILLWFKKKNIPLIVTLLLISSVFITGYKNILLAPGFNPLRHFFDISVFYLFYLYLEKNNIFYLSSSLLIALFSILWNKHFGLFLFSSILITSITYYLSDKKSWVSLTLLAIIGFIGFNFYFLPFQGKNLNTIYTLLRMATPSVNQFIIFCFSAWITVFYFILITHFKKNNQLIFLLLALFLYAQCLFIYFFSYPNIGHLTSNAAPLLLFSALSMSFFMDHDQLNKNFFLNFLLFIAFSIYLVSEIRFYYQMYQYNKIFKTHVLYKWNFPGTQFKSTMDPFLFEKSIHLIKKYEKSTEILLISQYNTLFPLLIRKSNIIPYIDLSLNLVTSKEIDSTFNLIKHRCSKYAFIDTDITRTFNNDIFNPYDLLARENNYASSLSKAMVQATLQKLYKKVLTLYTPIEKGELITVYQIKANSCSPI